MLVQNSRLLLQNASTHGAVDLTTAIKSYTFTQNTLPMHRDMCISRLSYLRTWIGYPNDRKRFWNGFHWMHTVHVYRLRPIYNGSTRPSLYSITVQHQYSHTALCELCFNIIVTALPHFMPCTCLTSIWPQGPAYTRSLLMFNICTTILCPSFGNVAQHQ